MKNCFLLLIYLLPIFGIAQKKKMKEVPFMVTSTNLKIVDPRTEQLINPLGLDIQQPRFSWKLESSLKNTMQTAYEITVASAEDFNKNAILWTIKKDTDRSIYNVYEGPTLISNTRYFWYVKVWDNQGNVATSEPQYWHTGFLNKSIWTAKWIGADHETTTNQKMEPCPLLRKEFALAKPVKSAMLFITSKGLYEAHINGKKVGIDFLTPGWTSYNKRTQYQAYDVTGMLKKGNNAIGAILGKGWYKGELGWVNHTNLYGKTLGLLAQVMITFTDGTKQIVQSDDTWLSSFGPILDSEIYHGEKIDARQEKQGWNDVGFNSGTWKKVSVLNDGIDHLIGTYGPPVRKREVIKPIKLIITPEKDTVLDFGQNMVGWVKVKATGPIGTTIKIWHAEVLDKKGNFYIENLRNAKQLNEYTLSGSGEEIFEPHFTFQGFRYVKVSGYPAPFLLDKFEGMVLYSDMEKAGSFECSNPLVNQLQHNIQWGQRGNFVDVPTDCPQRDERLGWTGDAQAFARTAAFNFNVQNFFAKWLLDLAADQNPNGSIPHVVPNALNPAAAASAGWADAGTIIPWNMYWIYGDKSFLERQYPSMKNWVKYMQDSSKNYLWNKGFHFGDWLFYSIGDDRDGKSAVTDKYLIAQCFFANSIQLMINSATVLNKMDDVKYFTDLLANVKTAFQNEYVTANGRMISGTQTAYVLALQFDMLPTSLRPYAVDQLVKNIKSYNYHITTGFLGTPYISHVLSKYGFADVAYKLLFQDTYPSWLYPVKMGATTIWERWDGIKPDGDFQTATMNSFNHYAYGAIGDWMYRSVAGIEIEAEGYKKSIIRPTLTDALSFASAGTQTPYGTVRSGWYRNEGGVEFSIEIPGNTTSTVILPLTDLSKLAIDGIPIATSEFHQKAKIVDNEVKIYMGSGKYTFKLSN